MRTIKFLLAAGFLLMSGTSIYAQVQRNEAYLPKFAIKTNALYWATSTPNLGFEVGLAKKLTLDISGNYRGNSEMTARLNIGLFSRNCVTGFANVSTEVSSVCTDTTEK